MVIAKKICLIGDFAVGKTSLIRRYVDRQFSDHYLSTVGVKISRKQLEIKHQTQAATQLQLVIWDLEGRTQFEAIVPSYLQGASGAIIVGALDRQTTLESLASHVQLFLAVNPQQPVVVALNKVDLLTPDQQQLVLAQSPTLAQGGVVGYWLTSAKTGHNVDQLFEKLAQAWV